MRTIGAAEFKQHCLSILDELGPEGVVVTKRGKPVARVMPYEQRKSMAEFIGIMKDTLWVADENDDLFSTGAWISDEWGDLNSG